MNPVAGVVLAIGALSLVFARRPIRFVYVIVAALPFHMLIRSFNEALSPWKELAVGMLLLFAIAVALTRQDDGWEHDRATRVLLGFLFAYLGWTLVRFLGMEYRTLGWFGLREHVLWPCFFLSLLLLLRGPGSYNRLLNIWIVCGIIVCVIGLYESTLPVTADLFWQPEGVPKFGDHRRIRSTFDSMLSFAAFLGLLIPVLVGKLITTRARTRQLMIAAAIIVASLALALTFSRGPLLMAAFGTAIAIWAFAAYGPARERRRVVNLALALIVIAGIGGAAAVSVAPALEMRVQSITDWQYEPGNLARIQAWEGAIRAVRERPWIGYGPGITSARTLGEEGSEPVPESQFLKVFVEMGIVGLVFFIPLLTACIVVALRAVRRHAGTEHFGIALGTAASIIAFPVELLILQIMEAAQVQVFFWLLVGGAVALARVPRATGSAAEQPPEPALEAAALNNW